MLSVILYATPKLSDPTFQVAIYNHGGDVDYSARLAVEIYSKNCSLLGPKYLTPFLNSLSQLGLAFTELQVINAAASHRLFLSPKAQTLELKPPFSLSSLPKVGEFVCIGYQDNEPVGWKRLGMSCHVQDTVCCSAFKFAYCSPLHRTWVVVTMILVYPGAGRRYQRVVSGSCTLSSDHFF